MSNAWAFRFAIPMVMVGVCMVGAQQNAGLGFFITSVGSGKGADFGGLEGADKHCQKLAQAAGAGNRTWRAYLSARRGSQAGQRQGPHRRGALGQRQGRGRRHERRGPAQRRQQVVEGEFADREGRGRQRPRRHAEPPRHPHRARTWTARSTGRRRYLQQLDEQRRGQRRRSVITIARAAAPTRPRGTPRTPSQGLQPGQPARRPAATGCSTASRRNRLSASGFGL